MRQCLGLIHHRSPVLPTAPGVAGPRFFSPTPPEVHARASGVPPQHLGDCRTPTAPLELAPDTTDPQPVTARPVRRSTVRFAGAECDFISSASARSSSSGARLVLSILRNFSSAEPQSFDPGIAQWQASHPQPEPLPITPKGTTGTTSLTCRGRISFHCSASLFVTPVTTLSTALPFCCISQKHNHSFVPFDAAGSEPPSSPFNHFPVLPTFPIACFFLPSLSIIRKVAPPAHVLRGSRLVASSTRLSPALVFLHEFVILRERKP